MNGRGYKGFVEPKGAGPLLAAADFHGAMVEVVRSRCVGRVGLRGIVVRDTKFTFEIVTMGNVIKGIFFFLFCLLGKVWLANGFICVVVPKEHTIFRFEVPVVEDERIEGEDVVMGEGEEKKHEKEKGKSLVFELYGDNFTARASDRSNRKVALHLPPDL